MTAFSDALLANDFGTAKAQIADRFACIDPVYGVATGAEAVQLFVGPPRPAFRISPRMRVVAGPKEAAVELAIDPHRPRAAHWVRLVEGKIAVIEAYWMLREIGVNPYVEYSRDRHLRKVIFPA